MLNNTRITVGVNNIFGQRPPTSFGFEAGNSVKYPGFSYDNIGRFVYVELKEEVLGKFSTTLEVTWSHLNMSLATFATDTPTAFASRQPPRSR